MKERKTIIEFKKTTIILRSILNTSAPPPPSKGLRNKNIAVDEQNQSKLLSKKQKQK